MSLGIGLSGVSVALISFATLWWSPPTAAHEKTPAEVAPEAFSYFLLSSVVIAAAVVTYIVFFRTRFVHHHTRPHGVPPARSSAQHAGCNTRLLRLHYHCSPLPSPSHSHRLGAAIG
jgi:hypothetical protein